MHLQKCLAHFEADERQAMKTIEILGIFSLVMRPNILGDLGQRHLTSYMKPADIKRVPIQGPP